MNAYKKWYETNKEKAREQKRIVMRRLRAENPEKYAQQSKDSKARIRQRIFEKYGRVCARCGFDDCRILTLDHVLNNGAEERKEIGIRGTYYRALDPQFESEYQILCMNCQFVKRIEEGKQN